MRQDYEAACGLHLDSASIVKVTNSKAFIYDQYNVHFQHLMNVEDREYLGVSTDDINLKTQLTDYRKEINSCNNQLLSRCLDVAITDSIHSKKNKPLTIKCNRKEPIYNRSGSKIIGIYTSSVDKTKELDKGELYKKYLNFYDKTYAKTGKPDKTDRTANRQYLQAIGLEHLFYKIPTCSEMATLITVASTNLSMKEIAKVVGTKQYTTLRTQLQNCKKCLKNEYVGDDISLYKPFFKPCIL